MRVLFTCLNDAVYICLGDFTVNARNDVRAGCNNGLKTDTTDRDECLAYFYAGRFFGGLDRFSNAPRCFFLIDNVAMAHSDGLRYTRSRNYKTRLSFYVFYYRNAGIVRTDINAYGNSTSHEMLTFKN